ncbi:MAG TPA: murein L,D-transpeptidase catalytic domain family protein, partial [Thermoanaerobaculia bacterium]|nr:murein L,D-transpeptidase catalytic domain family protein [Thermoanaerobaculia bacterium]
ALQAVEAARARGVSARSDLLTVIDYSLPSTEPRLWVLDLARREVLYRELVAHGKGTGDNYATRFSNVPESRQTSLGLFLTGGTYVGGNGYSMKLHGLDEGLNDRAEERYIVMHGAWYVSPQQARAQGRIGRSWGCPAVPEAVARPMIDTLKGGSFVFSYHPELIASGAASPASVRAAR